MIVCYITLQFHILGLISYEHHPEPTKRITPHGFRHNHAYLLFESGAFLKDV